MTLDWAMSLDTTPKAYTTKEKKKRDFVKPKFVSTTKNVINRTKR